MSPLTFRPDEALRLDELSRYAVVFDEPEELYSDFARIATTVLNTPFGGVSLVDDQHVWLKGRVGLDLSCLDRSGAFCAHAVDSNRDVFVVNDASADPRFSENPLVSGEPHIRYYASATLLGERGYRLGTIWVMDTKPRAPTELERNTLLALACQVVKILDLTYHDPVTRLPNRSSFLRLVQHLINETADETYETAPLGDSRGWEPLKSAVGYIRINNLHAIRSAYGHKVGDQVLTRIAQDLRIWIGSNQPLAHVEPDGFGFMLSTGSNSMRRKLLELLEIVRLPIELETSRVRLNCSVGVSYTPKSGTSASSLLDQAAGAASPTPEVGEATLKTFDEGDHDKTFQLMETHSMLPLALQHRQLTPYYQPQVDLSHGGDVVGFEALARIVDPRIGIIGPQFFLPVAEQTGLITQVDLQILEAVCIDLRNWLDEGLPVVPVSVNFSRTSLANPAIVESIQQIVTQHRIATDLIEFEITEGGISASSDLVQERVDKLQAAGFNILIDDFGTGLSNLAMLSRMNFHRLKADRLYVHGASANIHVGGILRFILSISELFQVGLICEGVEEVDDLDWIVDAGGRYFQGWYFSRAVPNAKATRMLAGLTDFRSTSDRCPTNLAEFLQTC